MNFRKNSILKGLIVFHIIFLVLLFSIITAFAEEIDTEITEQTVTDVKDEIETPMKDRYVIINNIGRGEIYYSGYNITFKNTSSKKIKGFKISIIVDGKEMKVTSRKNLKESKGYNIDLTDYFSETFLEGKIIVLEVKNCLSGWEIFWIVFLLLLVLGGKISIDIN